MSAFFFSDSDTPRFRMIEEAMRHKKNLSQMLCIVQYVLHYETMDNSWNVTSQNILFSVFLFERGASPSYLLDVQTQEEWISNPHHIKVQVHTYLINTGLPLG